jgi:hypothetical protein
MNGHQEWQIIHENSVTMKVLIKYHIAGINLSYKMSTTIKNHRLLSQIS